MHWSVSPSFCWGRRDIRTLMATHGGERSHQNSTVRCGNSLQAETRGGYSKPSNVRFTQKGRGKRRESQKAVKNPRWLAGKKNAYFEIGEILGEWSRRGGKDRGKRNRIAFFRKHRLGWEEWQRVEWGFQSADKVIQELVVLSEVYTRASQTVWCGGLAVVFSSVAALATIFGNKCVICFEQRKTGMAFRPRKGVYKSWND